jgi:hypothetical protein
MMPKLFKSLQRIDIYQAGSLHMFAQNYELNKWRTTEQHSERTNLPASTTC